MPGMTARPCTDCATRPTNDHSVQMRPCCTDIGECQSRSKTTAAGSAATGFGSGSGSCGGVGWCSSAASRASTCAQWVVASGLERDGHRDGRGVSE